MEFTLIAIEATVVFKSCAHGRAFGVRIAYTGMIWIGQYSVYLPFTCSWLIEFDENLPSNLPSDTKHAPTRTGEITGL